MHTLQTTFTWIIHRIFLRVYPTVEYTGSPHSTYVYVHYVNIYICIYKIASNNHHKLNNPQNLGQILPHHSSHPLSLHL